LRPVERERERKKSRREEIKSISFFFFGKLERENCLETTRVSEEVIYTSLNDCWVMSKIGRKFYS
jgi:hypothetical protein